MVTMGQTFQAARYAVMIDKPLETCSPLLQRALNSARMIAPSDAPILIQGECGSGRTTLAMDIHRNSRRRNDPFQRWAHILHDGLAAGTLFIPDIERLSPQQQLQLRLWLDAKGESAPRIVASSDGGLLQRVNEGEFSADLYYRLAVVSIDIPPLRDRLEDLVPMLKAFNGHFSRERGISRAPDYPLSTRNRLKAHPWPGNLRELRNLCERMVLQFPGETITPDKLPQEFQQQTNSEELTFRLPRQGIDLTRFEAEIIRQAVEMAKGNRSKAARLLGISRDTLLYRLRKHAISL